MTDIVGGLRARLVRDSLFNMISQALSDRGWFNPARQHKPINFVAEPVDVDEEVPLNTLALGDGTIVSDPSEMGSNLAEHRWMFYLDFYAENTSVGMDMVHDLKAILEGRLPSIGRSRPAAAVYDYTQATPPVIAVCEIENVIVDRARGFPRPWQKYWYACDFDVVDEYSDEGGSFPNDGWDEGWWQ